MKTLNFALITLLLFQLFTSCKKGEDDPAISLRSRKARVEGNWKMDKGFTSQVIFGSTIETTFTSNSYRMVSNYNGNPTVTEGPSEFTLNFTKDGAVTMQKNLSPIESSTISGTWNFTAGIGKLKNKEQLVIHDPSVSVNRDIVYAIKELRNKKLVLYRNYEVNTFVYSEEFTFIQ